MLKAVILPFHQRIVLDCVDGPGRAPRDVVITTALWEEALAASPLVSRAWARRPFFQNHMTEFHVVLLFSAMMASLAVLRVEIFALHHASGAFRPQCNGIRTFGSKSSEHMMQAS